jgi:dolichol-phosphate mannosyltransferase
MNVEKPQLSIVIPAYDEETNIEKLYHELFTVLNQLDMSWEIIISDDGSKDHTWEEILSLHQKDDRVKGVRLSRNFGHQYALFAGLSHAMGDGIISMDADLQHPPHVIPQLIQEWKKGNKIVNTKREDPEEFMFLKKVTSRLFCKIFSLLCGVKLQSGMADFRLMDRQVLDDILKFPEEGLFLRGLVQWVGYSNSIVTFLCQNRYSGLSKYTLRRMLRFAWTGLISFSIIPLRLGIIIGFVTSGIAFLFLVHAVYEKLFSDTTMPGWASAVSITSFLFGILFIMLGIVGEYIGRILTEVRARPRFLIREQVGIGYEGEEIA